MSIKRTVTDIEFDAYSKLRLYVYGYAIHTLYNDLGRVIHFQYYGKNAHTTVTLGIYLQPTGNWHNITITASLYIATDWMDS